MTDGLGNYLSADGALIGGVGALKTAVVNSLRAGDPSVSIRTTEYFNHTFAPDMVLSWGDDATSRRSVFLRTKTDLLSLREDLAWVAPVKSILMPLDGGHTVDDSDDVEGRLALQTDAAVAQTLVAPATSLEVLVAQSSTTALSQLLASSVLKGGRGLLSETRAERTGVRMRDAYAAAQSADPEPVVQVVDDLESSSMSLGRGSLLASLRPSGLAPGPLPRLSPALRESPGRWTRLACSFYSRWLTPLTPTFGSGSPAT